MNHIEDSLLQTYAEEVSPVSSENQRHLAECARCRSELETYRFMALQMTKSSDLILAANFTSQVMSRISSWEERRAYWKEWMWIWVGSAAGLLATIVFTLMPASGIQLEKLTEWGSLIHDRASLVGEQIVVLFGNHFHLIVLAVIIILAFELFDKRLIRRLHAGMK